MLTERLTSLPASWYLAAGTGIAALVLLWLILLTVIYLQNRRLIRRVFGQTKKEELKEILQEHIERVGVVQIKLNDLENIVREMKAQSLTYVQKIGVVRFNPFEDTGSDQSFAIAILDAQDNGLVISALHSRERTRLYAKPVKAGKAEKYPLSDEEEESIRKAKLEVRS